MHQDPESTETELDGLTAHDTAVATRVIRAHTHATAELYRDTLGEGGATGS